MIRIRDYCEKDLTEMIEIWNEVVKEGVAFPQEECLDKESGLEFFNSQTATRVAEETDTKNIVGLYILHPNNVGRCSHISNASYAVKSDLRDKHVGEKLVRDSLDVAKHNNFKILQFNAVVRSNDRAKHLYDKLGFIELGIIPGGFRLNGDTYEDIVLYYHLL